jgi:DnaJ family protein C protein 19
MIMLFLGLASLLVLMGALGMFSRAQVATLKSLGVWVAAIGGLALAGLLFLTGRGGTAIAALVMLGPLVWSWIGQAGAAPGVGQSSRGAGPGRPAMGRDEAYQILGLRAGASEAEIRAAHRRLMQGAHPDHGGSDWLAARINQARDVLLG